MPHYRSFGHYVSETTYYTVAVGVGGIAVGLVVGLFIAIPLTIWRRAET